MQARRDIVRIVAFFSLGSAFLGAQGGCGDSPTASSDDSGVSSTDAPAVTDDAGQEVDRDAGGSDDAAVACTDGDGSEGLDPTSFDPEGLVTSITEEECTLGSGAVSNCYRITLRGAPTDHEVGPFCPRTITDTADVAGIWIESGSTYDVDGAFIRNLATFYSDPEWQLYDPATGNVRVTETAEACAAAARPDVDPEYNNYCVECALEDAGGGVETTVIIPVRPTARSTPQEIGMAGVVGVALNGVAFDPPAPVGAILAAHTIAAFDDCGGHVNLAAGYHYHAATGCSREVPSCDGHAPRIGYALDGYAIHAMTDSSGAEPADLDECRGHSDATRGYHYHVAAPGENMFVGCFHGEIVGTTGGGMMGGMGVIDCGAGMTTRCCGDGVCDGPETVANCAEDCS